MTGRIGAAAVVRTLVERGAIGLVTTHDLALASIAKELGARAENVHFEDDFRDGKIFSITGCKPGLLERGNALALMRSIGLDV
jgi:DNA mismatch repair ATPase MutS